MARKFKLLYYYVFVLFFLLEKFHDVFCFDKNQVVYDIDKLLL